MTIHELKTDDITFQAAWRGDKAYEIRINDRDYKISDQLILKETVYPGEAMKKNAPLLFSGRQIIAIVTHILYGPILGLAQDWCIMSIRVIWKRES